jgi:hypothetical protein
MEITLEELYKLLHTWESDLDLRKTQRFGQFVCNRKMKAGRVWPECYYASHEKAWELLFEVAYSGVEFEGTKLY